MTLEPILTLEEGWEIMQEGIKKIERVLEGREKYFSPQDHDKYSLLVLNMCTQRRPYNHAIGMYKKYKHAFEKYINYTVLPSLREKHDEFMLRELVKRWENHKLMVSLLSEIFSCLGMALAKRGFPSVNEVGLTCFRDLVYFEFRGKARDAVIRLIDAERDGGQIERTLLKNVLDIFVDVGMGQMKYYQDDFEDAMLKDTSVYYSRKVRNWIVEDPCMNYILKVEECCKNEKDRVYHYLHFSSKTKLLEKVQSEFLAVYTNKFLEKEHSGGLNLLRDCKVEDLSRLYKLFQGSLKLLEPIANMYKQHVIAQGMVLVQQAEDVASNKVNSLGGLQEQLEPYFNIFIKYSLLCNDLFANNSVFHTALIGAFEFIYRKISAGSTSAELLASYCDDVLRYASKSDDVFEERLNKVVKIIAYISDRALFSEFYRNKLFDRLVSYRSANDAHEILILSKLKQQCGGYFTSEIEQMVADLKLAKEDQNSFREHLRNNPAMNPGIDLNITVLKSGLWPRYSCSGMRPPVELIKCVEVFDEFYKKKMKHRKLTWMYSSSTCSINGNFDPKTIELIVGVPQAAILLLFNTSDRLSYSEIKQQLNLADDDLIRLLQSLSCDKYHVLIKEPNNTNVTSADHFEYNSKFTDTMRRIKIPLLLVDEMKKVVEDIEKDRRYVIDACIVRIMKRQKVLPHQQLIMECVEQLRGTFKPDIEAIEQRVGALISREYLGRDDPNSYKYLA